MSSATRFFTLLFGLSCLMPVSRCLGTIPATLLGDTFKVVPEGRASGSDLKGQKAEIGGAIWDTYGKVVLTADGAVTSTDETASMGILPLPKSDGALDLSADLSPQGSGFTALAFLPGPSAGDFWNTTVLWVFLLSNGDYQIRSEGEKTILKRGTTADYAYKASAPIHVDLICDPVGQTATVKLNGTLVLRAATLVGMKPVTHVAFRFNEKIVPGQPKVSNFSVATAPSAIRLKPESAAEFYINPDQPATLHWTYSALATVSVTNVLVHDYSGQQVAKLKAQTSAAGKLEVPIKLPQGFYTLDFPETNQEFGLAVIPSFQGKPDPFFGLDMALTELTTFNTRADLISVVKRGGINTGRERFAWGLVQQGPDSWAWDVGQQTEATRKLYEDQGMGVLELFAGAPGFIESDWHKFPKNLNAVEHAWETIGMRFQPYWHGVEVWNEPDTPDSASNSPANEYLPIVKAIHYAFYKASVKTPIGDGVFAYTNKPYLDLAARNGLLDQADFLSFHYYGAAQNMEAYIQEYRSFLKSHGNPGMPLWITEMGPPWTGTPNTRALAPDDSARALMFARNAVEARACGIAEISPFVMVNYSEQDSKVFGMLDAAATPLRPMGSYLEAIRMLSGTTYIGDLKNAPGSRVFQRDATTAIVVYLIQAPPVFPVKEMRGIDGRLLTTPADGLTYLVARLSDVTPELNTSTAAMDLTRLATKTNPKLVIPSPVILAPEVNDPTVVKTTRGYQIAEGASEVPVHIRLVNLGQQAAKVHLTISSVSAHGADAVTLDAKDLAVAPGGETAVDVPISIKKLQLDDSGAAIVQITGSPALAPAAVSFIVSRGLKEQLASHSYQFALPIADLSRWQENSAGHGTFGKTEQGGWTYDISYGGGDKWAYPRFTPPQEVDLSRVSSILIRARCQQPAEVRVMTFDQAAKESHTPYSIIKADGQWHVALVPLESFLQATDGKAIAKQIHDLSVGLNSETGTNRLEVSDLYLLGN